MKKGMGSENQASRKSNPPNKTVKVKRNLKIIRLPGSNFEKRIKRRINKVAKRKEITNFQNGIW